MEGKEEEALAAALADVTVDGSPTAETEAGGAGVESTETAVAADDVKDTEKSGERQETPGAEMSEEELWVEVEKMVRTVVQTWTLVQMAVERMWGGTYTADKVEDMILAVLDSFSNPKKADLDDLLTFLDDFVLKGLNVVAEDGSVEEVALLMWDLYCDIGNGDLSGARALQAKLTKEQAETLHAQMHPEEQAKAPPPPKKEAHPQPQVDDDGWETVKRKPKRR